MNCIMRGFLLRHLVFTVMFLECTRYTGSSAMTTNAPAAASPPPPLATLSQPPSIYSPNCSAVADLLKARGLKSSEILNDPTKDSVHRFCELPPAGSCCTYKIEAHLSAHARDSFQGNIKDLIGKLSNILGTRAHKLNEIFIEMLTESKKEFHSMFKRTYGNIYEENSEVFSNMFSELENYYTRGKIDLAVSMDSFFNILYQKMFTVLNSQYILNDKYLGCVSEHMKELRPFGDIPQKLSIQVKKAFVATRTYSQALSIAADLAKTLMNVRINADCIAALTRMQQCNLCKGYSEKPCANHCVNVMKGCLHYYTTLDNEWDNFVSFMDKVSERLLGSFDIVMAVEPLNIKISEAIMNYQEGERQISDQVFKGCGDPILGRRTQPERIKKSTDQHDGDDIEISGMHVANGGIFSLRNRTRRAFDGVQTSNSESIIPMQPQGDQQDQRPQRDRRKNRKKGYGNKKYSEKVQDIPKEPPLTKILKDIRQKIKDTKKFWSNLPYQLCNFGELASVQPGSNESCWNGHDIVEREVVVTKESGVNFDGISQTSQQKNMVTSQLYYLKTAVSNLRNAYNGLDVEWPDQEEPFESSGYGSGDGMDDLETGSGSSSFAETIPKQSETPSIYVSTASTGITTSNGTKKTIGSSTGHENDVMKTNGAARSVPQMSLRRALVTYLFPIYMAWFGGIISDLL